MWTSEERNSRLHKIRPESGRTQAQKDYDRILYSSALRRLAGITQIVRAGEADVFHTRQQHTFKVAQIGRRLAQALRRKQPTLCEIIGLNEDVVEAACLAHDLGHPPFGHMGEHVLDTLCVQAGDLEGFEGNAQSFRIVTRLAMHKPFVEGLDLTCATLAACIKYPWLRNQDDSKKRTKWGAYTLDLADFNFARAYHNDHEQKTLEAEVMDWSDDVTYSVHDLDDFHRCNVIPWRMIFSSDGKEGLFERTKQAWFQPPPEVDHKLLAAIAALEDILMVSFLPLTSQPYTGSSDQRVLLRALNSRLIERYIGALRVREEAADDPTKKTVAIEEQAETEVRILKQITRDYIRNNPSLAAQQAGQKRVLQFLFQCLKEDSRAGCPAYLPDRLKYLWNLKGNSLGRFCVDCISSLTEAEVMRIYGRLSGIEGGSVLDPIVR